jgi:hypothetical protein
LTTEGSLAIGGDEGAEIQVLRRSGDGEYSIKHSIRLVEDETDKEIDIEGIAFSEGRIYVIGSHSRRRSKIDSTKTREQNRARFEESEREPLRENLFELRINEEGEPTEEIELKSLSKRIRDDEVLGPFAHIPSKENGVDIEGIAAVGDELYVGFRGPVLRERHVPVLAFDFDRPEEARMLYVNLGGRGIRDRARVSDGFLLIGGPVGDEPYSYELYHWDGEDGVEGVDGTAQSPTKSLGSIPLPGGNAKAEGIAVLEETDSYYDLLIVFDGPVNGRPPTFRARKRSMEQ